MNKRSVWRLLLTVYTALLAISIGAYIYISLMEVDYSFYVQGDKALEKNRPNAVRGLVRNVQTGKLVGLNRLSFSLAQTPGFNRYERRDAVNHRKQSVELTTFESRPAAAFTASLTPPDSFEQNHSKLLIEAENKVAGLLRAETNITVRPYQLRTGDWPSKTLRTDEAIPSRPRSDRETDAIELSTYPPDRELVEGITNRVYIATHSPESGKPVSCAISLSAPQSPVTYFKNQKIKTNKFGFGSFLLKTFANPVVHFEIKNCGNIDKERKDLTRDFSAVTAQVHLSTETPIVSRGSKASVNYRTLFDSGAMMVDLYHRDAWLSALVDHTAPNKSLSRIQFELPRLPDKPLFLRIQTYRSLFSPGDAWDIQRILLRDPDSSPEKTILKLIRRVLDQNKQPRPYLSYFKGNPAKLKKLSITELNHFATLLLSTIPRSFEPPRELVDTESFSQKRLEKWIARINGWLFNLIALLFGLGLAGFGIWFGSTQISASQTHKPETNKGEIELEEHGNRRRNLWMGLGFFVLLLLSAAGVLILLSYM